MKGRRANQKLIRVGVFYDGNYFYHVSNYYNYVHDRKSRISVSGLHEYIKHKVAESDGDGISARHAQIVDAHYFRGRLSAREASQKGSQQLFYDRVFDDVLMSKGITTHYLPLRSYNGGAKEEKRIDVWLALEAFELASYDKFDVLVLFTADGEYVPLIRKLNTLGTRVMVLYWDFEYVEEDGRRRVTRTSQDLIEEVTYPVAMHEIIDNRVTKDSMVVNNLFVPHQFKKVYSKPIEDSVDGEYKISSVLSLKNGFGFIKYPPNNLFFHYSNMAEDCDFNDLELGDRIQFRVVANERGEEVAEDIRLIEE